MAIPCSAKEVTMGWISQILQVDIVPVSFKLSLNAHDGTGFLSDMARLEFTTQAGDHHRLILKMVPTEEASRKLVLGDKFDQVEIHTYEKLLPELIKILPELTPYICPAIHSGIQDERDADGTGAKVPYSSILILQDLKPHGYFMIGFDKDFGLPEPTFTNYFSQGLDFLAKFHAAGTRLENFHRSKMTAIFPWFPQLLVPSELKKIPVIHKWILPGFPALFKLLEDTPGTSRAMLSGYKKLETKAEPIFQKVLREGQKYATAIHGDLWTHNVLVSPTPGEPIKVIDWQMLGYADPTFDLSIYILEGLHLAHLTKENVLKSTKLYYEKYTEILLEKFGMNPTRNWSEFERFFETYGLAYLLFWLILGCPDMVTIPSYHTKVYRIFEIVFEFGLIDFLNECSS